MPPFGYSATPYPFLSWCTPVSVPHLAPVNSGQVGEHLLPIQWGIHLEGVPGLHWLRIFVTGGLAETLHHFPGQETESQSGCDFLKATHSYRTKSRKMLSAPCSTSVKSRWGRGPQAQDNGFHLVDELGDLACSYEGNSLWFLSN